MTSVTLDALYVQHEQATELQIQASGLLNDLTAQLITQLQVALATHDAQAIRDIDAFIQDVLHDCADDFAAEPDGVLHLMSFYDRDFTLDQMIYAQRSLR